MQPRDPQSELDRHRAIHSDPALADRLVLRALGEPVPELDEHLTDCPQCRAELDALAEVVTIGRDPVEAGPLVAPPAHVWDSIQAELSLLPNASEQPSAPVPIGQAARHRSERRAGLRWLAVAAAALVVIGGAVVGGVVIGRSTNGSSTATTTVAVRFHATLDRLGAPPGSTGTATIVRSGNGLLLQVHATGLPVRTGYYEVWLYDPGSQKMVAVGTLGTGDAGEFTVPQGIDLTVFHVVDVSAQDFDGNPAHKQSMLRGNLSS